MSQTELARNEFLARAKEIECVQRIDETDEDPAIVRTIFVHVLPSLDDPAVERLFELEGEMIDKYPKSRLDVQVQSIADLGDFRHFHPNVLFERSIS